MAHFTDTEGRKWAVAINTTTVKRVRALTEVDLLEVLEGRLMDRLYRDPVLLVDVLYAVCKAQADERSITDEQFGEAMAGGCIETAIAALMDALASFCPNQRDRAALVKVNATIGRAMEKARDQVEERLNSGELDRLADEAVQRAMHGSSSTSAPESAE